MKSVQYNGRQDPGRYRKDPWIDFNEISPPPTPTPTPTPHPPRENVGSIFN